MSRCATLHPLPLHPPSTSPAPLPQVTPTPLPAAVGWWCLWLTWWWHSLCWCEGHGGSGLLGHFHLVDDSFEGRRIKWLQASLPSKISCFEFYVSKTIQIWWKTSPPKQWSCSKRSDSIAFYYPIGWNRRKKLKSFERILKNFFQVLGRKTKSWWFPSKEAAEEWDRFGTQINFPFPSFDFLFSGLANKPWYPPLKPLKMKKHKLTSHMTTLTTFCLLDYMHLEFFSLIQLLLIGTCVFLHHIILSLISKFTQKKKSL